MSKANVYTIEINSGFTEFWRYNIAVTCGLFDNDGNQCGFKSSEDTIAPVGSNLSAIPNGVTSSRRLTFKVEDCHHLLLYIYIIPHTLPTAKNINDSKPFPLSIKVFHGDSLILHEKRHINQWSGANIEITANRL